MNAFFSNYSLLGTYIDFSKNLARVQVIKIIRYESKTNKYSSFQWQVRPLYNVKRMHLQICISNIFQNILHVAIVDKIQRYFI